MEFVLLSRTAVSLWLAAESRPASRPQPFCSSFPADTERNFTPAVLTAERLQLAKKYKDKTAWGTDKLFGAENPQLEGAELTKMVRWYTPAEVLKTATVDNAQLLHVPARAIPNRESSGSSR